jgi:hypothetical protein
MFIIGGMILGGDLEAFRMFVSFSAAVLVWVGSDVLDSV